MNKVLADKITDPDKKNEIIHYANMIGCKVHYNSKRSCLEVECYDERSKRLIDKKIEELSKK